MTLLVCEFPSRDGLIAQPVETWEDVVSVHAMWTLTESAVTTDRDVVWSVREGDRWPV
jgi:hypothetical protein